MNPNLLSIAGPLKNSTVSVSSGEFPIGRDPSNLLAITDTSLSRRHCVIRQREGGYWVCDLDSRNGTLVNGVAVKEQLLRHGDQLSVGDSVFVFLLSNEAIQPSPIRAEFDDASTHTTVQIAPDQVVRFHPGNILHELPQDSRLRRNLDALLRISDILSTVSELEELQTQILKSIFEIVPADSGAILFKGRNDKFASVYARNRSDADSRPVSLSRTITREVSEKGMAILGSDAPDAELLKSESMVAMNIRSVLCVPLAAHRKISGCIYLQTTHARQRFDEDHLQLLAAIAGISAMALENARRLEWLEQENLRLNTEINLDHNMVGESPRMRDFYHLLSRVAPTDSTVLIQGESGTGKELAARAIHQNSQRSDKPFVTINCAAIPEGLLEPELFGYEKGSFTGAFAQKKGRLEVADGGSVFLDEVGELASALQVKLLRVLQEHEFERVGGTRSISVDIRLIAATNRDLQEAVRQRQFREDLYYRLNVVSLTLPPLRERREDIQLLAQYFISKCSKRFGVAARPISSEALDCLIHHDWPGNVRELENAIQRALVMCSSDVIQPEDFPESILERGIPSGLPSAKYHDAVRTLKKQLILKACDDAKGNYTEAARVLGVHANYLHRLIRNLDLRESVRTLAAAQGSKTSVSRPRISGDRGNL